MSKFLVDFIQKTAWPQGKNTILTMSRRISLHRKIKCSPQPSVNRTSNPIPTSSKEKVQVLPEPIKSEADKKIYKTIRLDNGLTALLISDPSRPTAFQDESSEEETSEEDTESGSDDSDGSAASIASDTHNINKKSNFDEEKLAACALSVGVGSYSDPADIQGLAHFVEHMVFMGSEKYPKENEFDSFIKKKGGSDNASTDCEVTTFYFEIQEKHLSQALDIFSQFFVSPLMNKEAMQREREAIESEFAIAAPSDSNRKDQLLCSLFPEGHPARTFTWGNLKSLRDDINDDEKLHEAAHKFRKRHYSANRMTLAIQARMDIASLEREVLNTFSRVPTNKLPSDDFSPYSFRPDTVTPEFRSIYYVKPVADNTEVVLTWCLRSLISEYESKPHQYISYLLGHEGKGSLLSYLRKKVWALGIYTGNSESGIDYTTMYSLFSTQVVLTEDGLAHIDEVLEAIFSYINMLKHIGPSERIYEEIKKIEETNFRFDEEMPPAEFVETLAENMHFYPPEHFITGDRLYYKYDPKGIKDLLDCIRADTVNIMILSNKHATPINYDTKEKWFGTEYVRKEIPENWLKRWLEAPPYPQFHLPEKNIYLTTDFSLLPPAQPYMDKARELGIDLYKSTAKEIRRKMEAAEPEAKVLIQEDLRVTVNHFRLDRPSLLRRNRFMEVWYKPDFKFRFPTALLYFYFITPLSLKSPREACLLDVWTDSLQQNLKEEVYPANMADLQHSIYVGDKGLTVKVTGYNQNLHLLVELITKEMRKSTDKITEKMFQAIRDVRSRLYHNALLKPNKLSKDLRMQILLNPYITTREKSATIGNITLDDLKVFSDRFLSKLYMQALIQGNVGWYEAVKTCDNILENIKWESISALDLPKIIVHELPNGERKVRVNSLNRQSSNSVVVNYYQTGVTNPAESATLEVIMMLMEEPLFDALRTKEQLGYSVFSMMRYTFGVLGFSVTVNCQADKFSVSHVDSRIEAYLKVFAREMKRLSEKTLASTKYSLVQLKYTTDYELKEEVERNWKEVVTMEYLFDRSYREAEAIEHIKLLDLKRWIRRHLPGGNMEQYKKLSIQVVGYKASEIAKEKNKTTNDQIDYNAPYLTSSENDLVGDTTDGEFITDPEQFKLNSPICYVPKTNIDEF